MADLHARAFAGQGRAWEAEEFAALLNSPHVFAITEKNGFALGRAIADEAELLTIATHPEHRGEGLARANLERFHTAARARGATSAFLEVAEDNAAAIRLYRTAGYTQAGRRNGYYQRGNEKVDALLMVRPLELS